MAVAVLKVGWTNPQTDAFGAHPVLGAALDLNDGVTFTLDGPDAITLEAPVRTLVTAGNIRTQGERATRGVYRHNRRLRARVILGPMASYADLAANVRALVAWVSAPPAQSVTVQYQPAGASAPVYLDVVGAAHDIPADEAAWLRLQLEPVELVFLVRPGLRGDRVALSNLVVNPGFEAPSGPGIVVFNDTLANANAYAVVAGATPTISANVLTLPSTAQVQFGSSTWAAINVWQFRFQTPTGGAVKQPRFVLHWQDNSNWLGVNINYTNVQINHRIGGVDHVLATSAVIALADTTWYWLQVTQFPSVPGDPPQVQATLSSDAAGSIGGLIASVGPVATFDTATALAGKPVLWNNSTNSIAIGGAFANVHTVSLFGPGAWLCASSGTGAASGAWEQNAANTYGGGPVSSFGAARIDCPPAGTVNASWASYAGGAPAGSQALGLMAVAAAGNVLGLSAYARSSGLGANAQIALQLAEYDGGGSILRATTVQTLTGNQASWTTLSGSVTTGAGCVYAGIVLAVADATAGASANGTVWFDNAQVWNQTTTNAASMPYCELCFAQSPAQLVISGLLGDLPAPVHLAFGTYLGSWATGALLTFAIGRRARVSASAQLVGASNGFYGTAFSPQATALLDASSYGGYFAQATVTSAGWNPRAFSPHPADALGTYHLFERHLSKQTTGNLPNVQVRVAAQQLSDAWYGNANGTDQLGAYTGAWSTPLSASNVWTVVDAGQVTIPPLGAGALTDLAQNYITPRPQWSDSTGGGAIEQAGWQLLLPVDGALVAGVLNNPSNAPFGVSNQWLWGYFDGLGVASGALAGWTYSLEGTALPNPAHAGGGPGTQTTGAININSGADPYLTLDPTLQFAGNGGVNQFAAYIADGAAAVLPFHAELHYSPLYLWPR